ncbi:Na+/melibiose symporter [Streptomyces zhaozhouensis]|uniref:Multidrug efflux pump Tap n=1 Tax=Streptomyces zhaozhouensis TaxID=1300267 RepID=A0A286DNQ4_9ACTN|nr:MFS transporter [Streptomyces zhaozhouensis]SOD60347.1 Na+/melibiose symporter [Streptomyces zhaozhouensis]
MTRIAFLYLSSFGTSLLGNSVTAIALPLLVLFTTGSPLGAGVVAAAAAVPAAVAGLLMGSLIDRINRRTAAVLSDVISAVALLVLPIVDLTVGLNLGWFVAVAVLNSFGDVPGITAREAMLPAIAEAAGLAPARLIGLRESLAGVALLLGPAVAGVLVAALTPVTVLWITAGTAALAALLTLAIPARAAAHRREGGDEPEAARVGAVFDGLVILFRSPLLRGMVLLGVTLAVVLAATQGMVIPVHFAFHDEPQYVGFVLSALAAGLLVGGGLFATLGHRVPRRTWFTTGLAVLAVGFAVVGVLGPVWSIFAGAAIVGLGGGCMNAVVGLTFVENVDESRRGKVLGAQNAIMTLVPAAGVGGAAVLVEAGGLHLVTTCLAALWLAAATAALLSPNIRRLGREPA